MMPFDLPHSAFAQHVLPTYPYIEQHRPDPFLSWVPVLQTSKVFTSLVSLENYVNEISLLPEGWDGYGALRISPTTKYNTITALRGLLLNAPPPEITPNSNGTISFEWHSLQGDAHLEIGQTKVSFYIKPTSGDPLFIDGTTQDLLINAVKIGYLLVTYLFPFQYNAHSVTEVRLVNDVSFAH